jgi:peptidoglycan/LPS O-acetylase OafA/YrhL
MGIPFDLRDGTVLKGLAILAIVLHNYFHLLPSAATENEFDFNPQRFRQFLDIVGDPRHTFQAVFSYLGHFGVQPFIFLSAYGLALKHWTNPSWTGFVWSRIRKIYPTFLLALGLFLLLKIVQDGPAGTLAYLLRQGDELLLTTLAVQNLIPGYGLPPVGPWWFLPFIVQFYCLWLALAAFCRRFGASGLVVLSAVCLGLTMALQLNLAGEWRINFLTLPTGHMPELGLGIAYARFGFRVGPGSALVAAVLFILGNLYASLWGLTFISALVVLLYLYQSTRGVLRERRLLVGVGVVSMPLFFVNGFLRGPFWAAARSGLWYVELAVGLGFALVCVAVAYALWLVERRIVKPSTPGP